MALTFFPSAGTRLEIVCVSDPSVAAANNPEVLEQYERDGDLGKLNVPADASRFTIAPLTATARSLIHRDAGPLPQIVLDAQVRLDAATKAGGGERPLDEDDREALLALEAWKLGKALAWLRYGMKVMNDIPDATPMRRGLVEVFPDEHLERIGLDARREIADRIERASSVSIQGKAPSASRSGGRSKARAPSRARTARARSGKR